MSELSDHAGSLGLGILRDRLGSVGAAEPLDIGLKAPLAKEPMGALDQMRRRGLDPRLVEIALGWFDEPVERGLFAWDALVSGLYGPDQSALVEKLQKAARAVDDVTPLPGSAFAHFDRVGSAAFVEKLAAPRYSQLPLEAFDSDLGRRPLGLLHELHRRSPDALRLTPIAERTRQFAAALALGHMTTLASFYLDWLWRVVPIQAALLDLVEVLLDVGAAKSIPPEPEFLENADAERLELYGYTQARLALARWEHQQVFEELSGPDGSPRSKILLAEAGLELGEQPVPIAELDKICEQHPAWRYAHSVRANVGARFGGDDFRTLAAIDLFLARFGNDYHFVHRLVRYGADAGFMPGLRARMVREVTALPHDWTAWACLALVTFPNEADSAVGEIDARLRAQTTLS